MAECNQLNFDQEEFLPLQIQPLLTTTPKNSSQNFVPPCFVLPHKSS